MLFSNRQTQLLKLVIANDYISISKLSSLLNVSTRTVNRDLKNLSYLPYSLSLESSSKGIKIVGDKTDIDRFRNDLNNSKVAYSSKEERKKLLIIELLRSSEVKKLVYYASMFDVSEATISNDLKSIEDFFIENNLELIAKAGYGVKVRGSEKSYRLALAKIMHDSINAIPYLNYINIYDEKRILNEIFNYHNGIMNLLNRDILKRILSVFNSNIHELNLDDFAQSSYIGLIIHLTIAIKRIIDKEELENNQEVIANIKDDQEFLKAKELATLLELEFNIVIPEIEIAFIAIHLKAAKSNINLNQEIDDNLIFLVREMLEELEEPYLSKLKDDDVLIRGLSVHLKPAIIRIKNNMAIYNPLKDEVKKNYPEVYNQAFRISRVLEQKFQKVISEGEIAFIAIHLGAAIERKDQKIQESTEIKVGIICSSGFGLSSLLLARIKKIVDTKVRLKNISVNDFINKPNDFDLYISTFDLKSETDSLLLVVNTLLTNIDIDNIKYMIELTRTKIKTSRKPFKEDIKNKKNDIKLVYKILANLETLVLSSDSTVDEILLEASKAINYVKYQLLYQEFKSREKIQSNIYNKLKFALFHVKSVNVKYPKILFVYPKASFNSEVLSNIEVCIVMVASENRCERELLSMFTMALIEDDNLLDEIIKRKDISEYLEDILINKILEID